MARWKPQSMSKQSTHAVPRNEWPSATWRLGTGERVSDVPLADLKRTASTVGGAMNLAAGDLTAINNHLRGETYGPDYYANPKRLAPFAQATMPSGTYMAHDLSTIPEKPLADFAKDKNNQACDPIMCGRITDYLAAIERQKRPQAFVDIHLAGKPMQSLWQVPDDELRAAMLAGVKGGKIPPAELAIVESYLGITPLELDAATRNRRPHSHRKLFTAGAYASSELWQVPESNLAKFVFENWDRDRRGTERICEHMGWAVPDRRTQPLRVDVDRRAAVHAQFVPFSGAAHAGCPHYEWPLWQVPQDYLRKTVQSPGSAITHSILDKICQHAGWQVPHKAAPPPNKKPAQSTPPGSVVADALRQMLPFAHAVVPAGRHAGLQLWQISEDELGAMAYGLPYGALATAISCYLGTTQRAPVPPGPNHQPGPTPGGATQQRPMSPDHYSSVELKGKRTEVEFVDVKGAVKRWYRRMSQSYHPDRGGDELRQQILNDCHRTLLEELERLL